MKITFLQVACIYLNCCLVLCQQKVVLMWQVIEERVLAFLPTIIILCFFHLSRSLVYSAKVSLQKNEGKKLLLTDLLVLNIFDLILVNLFVMSVPLDFLYHRNNYYLIFFIKKLKYIKSFGLSFNIKNAFEIFTIISVVLEETHLIYEIIIICVNR